MKSLRSIPVALALGLALGCSKSEANDAMKKAGDAAKGAVESATNAFDGLKNIDLSDVTKLDPAKLQGLGKDAMSAIAKQLGSISDLASAKNVAGVIEPMLEKLGSLKTALGGKLPSMEEVSSAISSLTTKFTGKADIMGAIQPVLDKLKALIG